MNATNAVNAIDDLPMLAGSRRREPASDAPSPLLRVQSLGRRNPNASGWLLENISFDLHAGERVALAGPTGSGKTLLLRALALLDPVDAGAVEFQGRGLAAREIPGYRARVIYLHQRPALLPGSVEDNLRTPLKLAVHRGKTFDRAATLERLAGVDRGAEFLDREERHLSGGERQIVALLRAMQLNPDILLLDEPTAALDATSASAVETLVDAWQADAQTTPRTTVWVSHSSDQVARVADRILQLRRGRLLDG